MKKFAILLFILLSLIANSQIKKGGFFSRIDDPMNGIRNNITSYHWGKFDTSIMQAYKYNVKPTFAVICEYHYTDAYTLQPMMKFFHQKDSILKAYQDSGYHLAMHSINHSTNYYISHIDSLSIADQYLVDNGYSTNDGVDTIILNVSTSPITVWYWKRLPDNHLTWFSKYQTTDTDNAPDSIWYPRILPPKSVYISIYPNVAGLKKIITEQKRRFVLSGLNEPDVWIHPGQEYFYPSISDTLTETKGWIEEALGNDTITYHITNTYSSQKIPIAGYDKLQIYRTGLSYMVSYVSGTDSIIKLKLTGYTPSGDYSTARIKPDTDGNWMWFIDAPTMKQVARECNLKMAAIYHYGRQYDALGYSPSDENGQYFRWAHEWGHILLNSYTANQNINSVCNAIARNYIVGTNDHECLNGGVSKLDSLYNFMNANLKYMHIFTFRDLADSVYNVSSPYDNVIPSFDQDLNNDAVMDGWSKSATITWNRGGINIGGDTTYLTMPSNGNLNCASLWGIDKGDNLFSMYIKTSDADSVIVKIWQLKHRYNTDNKQDTISVNSYWIKNLTTNWNRRFVKINIDPDTDWITVFFQTYSGTAYAIKPELLKYNKGHNYY